MKHEPGIKVSILLSIIHNSLFIILFLLFVTQPVFAKDCDPNIPADCPAGLEQIEDIFKNVISVIVGLGFIATLVMLIMAGFKYLTSAGEPKAVSAAHQTVTWALLGVVFMAIAWLILQLIFAFTGINVTIFNIKILCGIPGGNPLEFCKP